LIIAQTHFGFLPTRGSIMLDFVFLAMFAIVIVLTFSIYLVRSKKKFRLHKRIQIGTAIVLLVTIVAFEIDMRFITAWRVLAEPSSLYASGAVDWSLAIHLLFAIPTPFVWVYTIVMALKKIPADPQPCEYSTTHRRWGWISALMMYATAVTGWVFYVVAFVF